MFVTKRALRKENRKLKELLQKCQNLQSKVKDSCLNANCILCEHCVMPVSYTHLDVYKRQVFFSTCWGVGQTTFFSSLRSSRKYFLTLPQVLLNQFSFLTSAMIRASLLGLVVNGVLLAESCLLYTSRCV